MGPMGPAGDDGVSPQAAVMVDSEVVALGSPLTVSGSGFRPGEPVVVSLVVDQYLSPFLDGARRAQVQANSGGNFTYSVDALGSQFKGNTVPRLLDASNGGANTLSIYASGADGSRASTPIRVVSSGGIAPAPSLALSSNSVAVESDLTIMAAGFLPGEFVTIVAVGASGGRRPRASGRPRQRIRRGIPIRLHHARPRRLHPQRERPARRRHASHRNRPPDGGRVRKVA